MPFAASWMYLEIIIQKEVSPDRERQMSYAITYMWNLKKRGYQWTYFQNRNRPTETNMVTEGESGGGINQEDRINIDILYIHIIIYIIDNQQGPTQQYRELYSISYNNL